MRRRSSTEVQGRPGARQGSFERPERTAKRANDTGNRYSTRHMEPQDASASCLVSAHDHISGTHTANPTGRSSTPSLHHETRRAAKVHAVL